MVSAAVPQPGDILLASYRLTGSDPPGSSALFPNAQILCSGIGSTVNSNTLTSMGTCTILAGTLAPGDRIDVRFDVQHAGSAGGFSFELRWEGSAVLHRDAGVNDVLVTARADAGLGISGAQWSTQSWGTVLPFAAGVGSAATISTAALLSTFTRWSRKQPTRRL